MDNANDIKTADAPPGSLKRLVRRFRSAASGLWYENPHAAGTINAVELNGQILERKDGEQTMPWIRRAAAWASAIHSANAKVCEHGGPAAPANTGGSNPP